MEKTKMSRQGLQGGMNILDVYIDGTVKHTIELSPYDGKKLQRLEGGSLLPSGIWSSQLMPSKVYGLASEFAKSEYNLAQEIEVKWRNPENFQKLVLEGVEVVGKEKRPFKLKRNLHVNGRVVVEYRDRKHLLGIEGIYATDFESAIQMVEQRFRRVHHNRLEKLQVEYY